MNPNRKAGIQYFWVVANRARRENRRCYPALLRHMRRHYLKTPS